MIKKILWWCSGANVELLDKSTYSDKQRYLSIGATVIITSILSVFSAYYAFYSVIDNVFSSVLLGLMWGILITSLNRLVFASIGYIDNSLKSTISLIPRLFIAITIALTLAFPFQIQLFETSINERIYKQRYEELTLIEQDYKHQINIKIREKSALEDQLVKESSGNGSTGQVGIGAIYKTLKDRIQIQEVEITKLTKEFQNLRQSRIDKKIGLLERIEALNMLRKESNTINITYYVFLLLFLMLELIPILLKLFNPVSLYDELLERSEYVTIKIESSIKQNKIQEDATQNKVETKTIFELYCHKIIADLEFQITKNRLKATELLRTGIMIIIIGILGYIGIAWFLVGVFFETHEFKSHYFYLMISLSLLFIFVQFLGGWFLKQYRRTLNTSLYLNSLKPNLDKYLLSYYVICEFSNGEERKNSIKELLLIISNEFKNIDNQLLITQEENFAKEVTDSINSLKDTIGNLISKLK